MGKIKTEELLNQFYESMSGTSIEKMRNQIDKPELYEYEKKIGKELIDMNVDEILGLIDAYSSKRKNKTITFMVSHSSFDQISTQLRGIFNYYIDNIELVRNPFNDKRLRGQAAIEGLARGKEPFRWSIVEKIIDELHQDFEEDRADYLELILLLFYNGFAKANEIVSFTEKDVDHRSRKVILPGKTVCLSERCYNLLVKFNKQNTISGWRGDFALCGWHNSYFKFIIRPSKSKELDGRDITLMNDIINRYISKDINDKYNTKINYRLLYSLGFYDYIVKKHGEEKTNKMITSYRDSEDVAELMSLAREYGVKADNISHLKRFLRPFIES